MGEAEIVQALRLKKIPANVISLGLEAIDESEYLSILSGLIEQKKRSVKQIRTMSAWQVDSFCHRRGFEMEEILRCVKQVDADVEYLG